MGGGLLLLVKRVRVLLTIEWKLPKTNYLHVLSVLCAASLCLNNPVCAIMVAQAATSPALNGLKPSGKQTKSKNQLRREKAKQKKAQQQPPSVRLLPSSLTQPCK